MNARSLPPMVCLASLLAVVPNQGMAQEKAPIVMEIDVRNAGAATISKERVLSNMRTQVGQPYSEQAVEEDVRSLYATGNVQNVRIFGERLGNAGIRVIVLFQGKSKVTSVELEGVQEFKGSSVWNVFSQKSEKRGKIWDKISVKPGDIANESAFETDRQAILEYYRGKGFKDVEVEVKTDTSEALGTTRVKYVVREGGKTAIKEVRFEGNTEVSSKELREVVKTRRYRFLISPILKTGRVATDQLADDVSALREFYHNKGFSDVEVLAPKVLAQGAKVEVVYPIREGQRYTIGKVTYVGARLFPEEKLQSVTKLRSGAVYSPSAIQADVRALQELYGAKGYVDFQANARTSSGGKNVTNLTFVVDEGAQAYVGRVNISGNTRTKDKVVRRELALAPGDSFNTVRMDASKQRLNNLNYFSKVEMYPSETGVSDERDLNVVLEEKRTGSLNFGAGFSSIDNLLGFVELTQSNFDMTNWPSFTGGGQKFRTRVQYGAKRRDASIGLTEPYFMDRKLSLGGEVFYHDASYVSDLYSERRLGFELVARKPITEFTFGRLGYRVEQIGLHGVTTDAPAIIRSQSGDRVKSQVFTGVTYDSRDSLFLTRKGEKVDVSTFVAGGPLGGDLQTYGWNAEASKYLRLAWDTILTMNAQIGVVDSWGGKGTGLDVPVYDRLFLGGANDLRGFRYRHVGGVGKVKEGDEPLGGKSLGRVTLEYTAPVIDKVRAAVFYDAGFVNEKAYDFTTSGYNADVGFGLRLDLPIGPIRIDYGIPVKQDPADHGHGRFNFNVGYQF